MAKFQIPEFFQEGFDRISNLSPKDIQLIAETLNKIPAGSGPKSFQSELEKVQVENISELAPMIFSLGGLLFSEEISHNQLAEELVEAFKERKKSTDKKNHNLKDNLVQILSNSHNLKITFKAMNLLSRNGMIYQDGKVITDIRLVFNDDISIDERKAVILHKFGVEYQKNRKLEEIYFALDSEDLRKLRDQIERALLKEEQIIDSYKNSIAFIKITD